MVKRGMNGGNSDCGLNVEIIEGDSESFLYFGRMKKMKKAFVLGEKGSEEKIERERERRLKKLLKVEFLLKERAEFNSVTFFVTLSRFSIRMISSESVFLQIRIQGLVLSDFVM